MKSLLLLAFLPVHRAHRASPVVPLEPFHAPSDHQLEQAMARSNMSGVGLNQSNTTTPSTAQQQQQAEAALRAEASNFEGLRSVPVAATPAPAQQSYQQQAAPEPPQESNSEYEVYGWWDVDCGMLGQPVCKSFKGDKGWCWVAPLGTPNRTMLVPAPRTNGQKYCDKCGSLGQPACPTMNGTSFCFPEDELTGQRLLASFYPANPSADVFVCVACGSDAQLACVRKGEAHCDAGAGIFDTMEGALATCGPCGGSDEPACTAAADGTRFCVDGASVVGGVCRSSLAAGGTQQAASRAEAARR